MRLFDPQRLPPRDADGHTFHPDMPEWDEGEDGQEIFARIGFELHCRSPGCTMSADEEEAFFESGPYAERGDCSAWSPVPPEGDGWLLVAIYDTEDGPCAAFARSIAYAARVLQ